MIFADKIIMLRKKHNMSQEQLAEKLDVSRQSISKWEGAQSIPDTNKIIQLAQIFGVSIDYLLRDDMEEKDYIAEPFIESETSVRQVSMEEANEFLKFNEQTAQRKAFAISLFILSPVLLVFLSADFQMVSALRDEMRNFIGLLVLFLLVVAGVAIIVTDSMQAKKFSYLEEEDIETAYGVSGMVRDRKEKYSQAHTQSTVIGICLCILSVIPVITIGILMEDRESLLISAAAVTLIIVAAGIYLLAKTSIIWNGMQKLLEEEDYSRESKKHNHRTGNFSGAYWSLVVVIYLGYSILTNHWEKSWVIWPIAGVLFAGISSIIKIYSKK